MNRQKWLEGRFYPGTLLGMIVLVCCAVGAFAGGLPPVQRAATGVYLLHDRGDLRLTILKRDLNIYDNEDRLQYQLAGPGWQVVRQGIVADDGVKTKGQKAAAVQREVLDIPDAEPGMYVLHLTPSNNDMLFGFDTSCHKYVMHGNITFSDTAARGTVYFPAPPKWAKLKLNAIHQFPFQIALRSGNGQTVESLKMTSREDAAKEYVVPADLRGAAGLWSIQADSLDFGAEFIGEGMGMWTTQADAWFPAAELRWIVYPKRGTICVRPGENGCFDLTLRNDGAVPRELTLEAVASGRVQARLADAVASVRLDPGGEKRLRLEVSVPADTAVGTSEPVALRVRRADDSSLVEKAAIEVRVGESPAGSRLALPVVLKPYEHENVQFGYQPVYPVNETYFDIGNRPYIRSRIAGRDKGGGESVWVREETGWTERPMLDAIRKLHPDFRATLQANGWLGAKVVFDKDNHAYTCLKIELNDGSMRCVLLYSPDGFRTVRAYDLPVAVPPKGATGWGVWGSTDVEIEQFTGHNVLDGPPPVVLWHWTAPHKAPWASVNDMKIVTSRKQNGALVLDEPVLVTRNSGGSSQHSGGAASTVTRDGKTHVIWWELSGDDVPGAPTWVATLDHATHQLSKPVLIGYGAPVNDCHNQPGILIDGEGYLHTCTGAHGKTFMYARSLKPNDASAWTKAEGIPSRGQVRKDGSVDGGQTYLSFLCDADDTIHVAYRMHRTGVDDYMAGLWTANLTYQRKKKSQPWEEPVLMVRPPLIDYSNYHHKMSIDRKGRLFLSYCYLTHDPYYAHIMPGWYHHCAIMMSDDHGDSWRFVRDQDFVAGIAK